jgi:hypothetical protein
VWSDLDDAVIGGDLTAALAYVTPAGRAVVTPVAPLGLRDRAAGTPANKTVLLLANGFMARRGLRRARAAGADI